MLEMSNSIKTIIHRESGGYLLPVIAALLGIAALTPVNPIFLNAVEATGASFDIIPVYAFHLINILLIVFLIRRDKDLACDKRNIWLFFLLYFAVQFFMLFNYYGNVLARGAVVIARPAYGSTNPNLTIDPQFYYIMDGWIDEWINVLYNHGIFAYPHNRIVIMEKGPLYINLFLCILFGSFNMYYPLVFNGLIITLSGLLIFKIGRKCSLNINAALFAAVIFALLPETSLWGGILHKDNLVIFLILSVTLINFKILIDNENQHYVSMFVAFLLMNSTRSSILLILLFVSLASPFLSHLSNIKRLFHVSTCLIIFSLIVFVIPTCYYFSKSASLSYKMGGRSDLSLSNHLRSKFVNVIEKPVTRLGGNYSNVDTENAAYTDNSIVMKLGGELSLQNFYFVPLRMVMFYLLPWPFWDIDSPTQALIWVGTLILIFLSIFTLFGLYSSIRTKGIGLRSLVLYLALFNLAIVFSGPWIVDRYRLMCVPFILLIGLKTWYDTSFKYRVYGGAIALGFYSSANLLYLLIK